MRELIHAQLAGGQDFDIAVIEHPSKERLAHLYVIDLLQRGIGDVLAEHAGELDHAAAGDHVLALLPDENVPTQADQLEDEQQVSQRHKNIRHPEGPNDGN